MVGGETETVRLAIYQEFASRGTPPSIDDLTAVAGSDGAAQVALTLLAEQRHIVLDDERRIVMAHPFASIPLGFAVMGRHTLWWGGCAWDAFALPHLLPQDRDVLVSTRCPGCGRALAWNVNDAEPPAGGEVAHFLTPVVRIWDDVVRSCRHQRLFCNTGCVDAWLTASGNQLGYVMDLVTLWRLAQGWYAGRLDHGYTRRDPSTAAAYFRQVGLKGTFWGL